MVNLKRFICNSLLIMSLLGAGGCKTLLKGNYTAKEEIARSKVSNVESAIGVNSRTMLEQIAGISYGVDYALSKVDEPSEEVKIAQDLNTRTMSLTGTPTVSDMNEMKMMVDNLRSQLLEEKNRGLKLLKDRDTKIYSLQLQAKVLGDAKDAEIRKYMKIASSLASQADAVQIQLDKMNSYLGLGAVAYGLKRLVTRMAWIIGIGSIVFIVLRFASMSSPAASAIFSIFEQIMSWVIRAISALAPKALSFAGQTTTVLANKYRNTMTKMIDCIQTLKDKQTVLGEPDKKYTLNELLVEFSKSLDTNEKTMIDKIKRDIGFND